MNRRHFLKATSAAAFAAPLALKNQALGQGTGGNPAAAFPPAAKDGWSPLFNGKNLDGWYTFLVRSGKNHDPTGYVRVENGMLHFLGNTVTGDAEGGYLATNAEYSNYHLRVDFKWGTARYAPRAMVKRDSGVYTHLTGPDRVWPTGMQLQVEETDVGDCLAVNGCRFTTAPFNPTTPGGNPPWPNPPMNAVPGGGPGQPRGARKYADFEKLDDWNTVEIIAKDDSLAFLVNGRLVNSLFNVQAPDPPAPENAGPTAIAAQTFPTGGGFKRLDRGKIALEIEFAEIWYRNVHIRPLGAGG